MFWAINERLDVKHQVLRAICRDVARGIWSPGDLMPAPHVLAKERILNPRIVESAYGKLVELGLLVALPDGRHRIADGARRLARDRLVEWAEEDVKDLIRALRSAGVSGEVVQRLFREAGDA